MKPGRVIGRVTLSTALPELTGARYLVVSPMDRETLSQLDNEEMMSTAPTPVVYDNLGGWTGDIVGYSEGREAAMPFDEPTAVDAYNCAILEKIDYRPKS